MSPFKELQSKVKNRASILWQIYVIFNYKTLANLDKSVINGMTTGSQKHYICYVYRLLTYSYMNKSNYDRALCTNDAVLRL